MQHFGMLSNINKPKLLIGAILTCIATVTSGAEAADNKIANLSINAGIMSFSYPSAVDILETSPAGDRLLNSSDFDFRSAPTTELVGSLNFGNSSISYSKIIPTDFSATLSFAAPNGHRLPADNALVIATARGSDMKAELSASVKSDKLLFQVQPTGLIRFNFGLGLLNISDKLSLESANITGLPNTTLNYDYTAKNELSGPVIGFDTHIPLGRSNSSISLSANIQKLKGTAKTTAKVESPNLSVQHSESFETLSSDISANYIYKLNGRSELFAGISVINIGKLAYSADQISGHDLRNPASINTAYSSYFSRVYKFGFKINF